MRLTIAALALVGCCAAGCTATNTQMQAPDLAELPDLGGGDQAQLPDLATAEDLAGVDFSGSDLTRPPDLVQVQDMARAPGDMATCGIEGGPCCASPPAFQECPTPAARPLYCYMATCQACGHHGQVCCGGNGQHVGGLCLGTDICAGAASANAGTCG